VVDAPVLCCRCHRPAPNFPVWLRDDVNVLCAECDGRQDPEPNTPQGYARCPCSPFPKPISDFYVHPNGEPYSKCKSCTDYARSYKKDRRSEAVSGGHP
jgi:hypothetical protein